MATLVLNNVTREEIAGNAGKSYAALIKSGEIFRVECHHSKKGNPIIQTHGSKMVCTDFNGNDFTTDGCILYNPAQVKCIVEACDDSDTVVFIVNGAVSTAPASTDIVKPIEKLKKTAK